MQFKRLLSFALLALQICLTPVSVYADGEAVPEEQVITQIEATYEEPVEEPESVLAEQENEPGMEALIVFEPDQDTDREENEDVYIEEAPEETCENLAGEESANNDVLFGAYFEKLLFDKPLLRRPVGPTNLDGVSLRLYAILAENIKTVAQSGGATVFTIDFAELDTQLSWTREELGGITLVSGGSFTDEAKNAVSARLDLGNMRDVMSALEQDLPYELYWYDKTAGVTKLVSRGYSGNRDRITVTGRITLQFSVAESYGSEYEVDQSQALRAQAAAENAHSIVAACASYPDEDKLYTYKNAVCRLASYNYEAAAGHVPYGDPWQTIYVFDGDESTKVVCEGYAKAFEYLCDLSVFESPSINCLSVTGTMNGAGHMWNIVTLEDGKNYLADLTNCDEATIGADDLLFLVGYDSGSVSEGYGFTCRGMELLYVCAESTSALMTQAQLTLTPAGSRITSTWTWAEDYSSASVSVDYHRSQARVVTVEADVRAEITPAGCTEAGHATYFAAAESEGVIYSDVKTVELPQTGHDWVRTEVIWGDDDNGEYGAFFVYECTRCGEQEIEFAVPTYTDAARGRRSYTAFDRFGAIETLQVNLTYTVSLDGAYVGEYEWGKVCVLSATTKRKWLINGSVAADGVNVYRFAVIGDTDITTEETTADEKQAAAAAFLASYAPGTAVFKAMWTLPDHALVDSINIYRGFSASAVPVSVDTLLSKGKEINTQMKAIHGSYELNLFDLNTERYQHVMVRILYSLDGVMQPPLDSAVQVVKPDGGNINNSHVF